MRIRFQVLFDKSLPENHCQEIYKSEQIGTRRVDFLLYDKISVELKAIIKLEPVHFAQAINYLEAYNLEIGLLLNFGAVSMEIKRLLNKKMSEPGFS